MHLSQSRCRAFTLVEVMIVLLLIGILLAIAIPNSVQARETSRAKSCIGNLKQIDSAKQQSAMDNKLSSTDTTSQFFVDGTTATAAGKYQLTGATGYIRAVPICPSNGGYDPGLGVTTVPKCDVGTAGTGDYAGPQSTPSVQATGKFYHGLSN